MFLLNMLIVGLVETGPNTFLLQLQAETGEIVEYTLSKNDRNFWSLFLLRIVRNNPHRGVARSLRSLRFAVQYSVPLRKPDGWRASA